MPGTHSNARAAYIVLLITAMIWGGNTVAGKLAVGHISPLMLTLMRWILAFAAILAISMPQIRKDAAEIKRNLPYLILMGIFGFTGFNALLYSSLHYTSAVNSVIEQAGIPMVIIALNFLLFRMRISVSQAIGFLLTLAGVALTASHGDLGTLLSLKLNLGDALMMGAVAVYAGYTVGLRYKPSIHWKSMTAATVLGAVIAAIPLAAFEAYQGKSQLPDLYGFVILLYTALFPSLVAQIFFIRGVEAIGSNRAGLFVNLVPPFGILFSVLLAGEPLFLFHIISIVLVAGGIILSESGSFMRKKAEVRPS